MRSINASGNFGFCCLQGERVLLLHRSVLTQGRTATPAAASFPSECIINTHLQPRPFSHTGTSRTMPPGIRLARNRPACELVKYFLRVRKLLAWPYWSKLAMSAPQWRGGRSGGVGDSRLGRAPAKLTSPAVHRHSMGAYGLVQGSQGIDARWTASRQASHEPAVDVQTQSAGLTAAVS